jgi:hypothetical protein
MFSVQYNLGHRPLDPGRSCGCGQQPSRAPTASIAAAARVDRVRMVMSPVDDMGDGPGIGVVNLSRGKANGIRWAELPALVHALPLPPPTGRLRNFLIL